MQQKQPADLAQQIRSGISYVTDFDSEQLKLILDFCRGSDQYRSVRNKVQRQLRLLRTQQNINKMQQMIKQTAESSKSDLIRTQQNINKMQQVIKQTAESSKSDHKEVKNIISFLSPKSTPKWLIYVRWVVFALASILGIISTLALVLISWSTALYWAIGSGCVLLAQFILEFVVKRCKSQFKPISQEEQVI